MKDAYKKINVLIVDDDMIMRGMIHQMLEKIGFHYNNIDYATGGQQALHQLNQASETSTPYDIVLLDWHMPYMSGLEVLEKCRQKSFFDKTAFMMVTAEKRQENVIKAVEMGAMSYLLKPISGQALEKNIKKAIRWLGDRSSDIIDTSNIKIPL